MELTRTEVDQILALVERADYDIIDIEWKGLHLNLRRGNASAPTNAPMSVAPMPASAAPDPLCLPAAQALAPSADTPARVPEGWQAVAAPTMGTFYQASEPGAPPFVTIGSKVLLGDTLGMVEVMKVFTAITTDIAGTVRHIYVEDNALVEYGQILFVIEPNA